MSTSSSCALERNVEISIACTADMCAFCVLPRSLQNVIHRRNLACRNAAGNGAVARVHEYVNAGTQVDALSRQAFSFVNEDWVGFLFLRSSNMNVLSGWIACARLGCQ